MRIDSPSRSRLWLVVLIAAFLAAVALLAVTFFVSVMRADHVGSAPEPTPGTSVVDPESVAGDLLRQLDALESGDGWTDNPYDRAMFGQAWYDLDRNGCDTRNDVLRRDLIDTVLKADTGGCKVLEGVLEDWYSGERVDFVSGSNTSRLVQVDHVVALAWAWRNGADEWADEVRLRFANDPLNLNATTEQQNSSKSDSGPADWLPAADAAQCRYAQRFVLILSEYGLQIGIRDRAMLRGMLIECAGDDAPGRFATAEEVDAMGAAGPN